MNMISGESGQPSQRAIEIAVAEGFIRFDSSHPTARPEPVEGPSCLLTCGRPRSRKKGQPFDIDPSGDRVSGGRLDPSNVGINPVLPAKVNPLTTIDAGVPSRNSSNWGGDSGAKLRLSRGVPPDSEGFERGQWS
jgi:hypothetical protein